MLMDFMVERPLTAFPGGEPALLRTLGEMVVRLQATTPFPPVIADFGALVEAMLNHVHDGGLGAPGVLDGHVAGPARPASRVRAEYPWADAQVSAHNDINPRNVLFDGERLWLVDWELAYRNDPLADVATIANGFSEVPDVETFVLEGWLGRSPDDNTRRRLALVRDHTVYAVCSAFLGSGGRTHRTDARRVPRPDHAWRATGDARAALRGSRLLDRGEFSSDLPALLQRPTSRRAHDGRREDPHFDVACARPPAPAPADRTRCRASGSRRRCCLRSRGHRRGWPARSADLGGGPEPGRGQRRVRRRDR